MKKYLFLATALLFALPFISSAQAPANNDAVMEDSAAMLQRLKNDIEANPDNLEAH